MFSLVLSSRVVAISPTARKEREFQFHHIYLLVCLQVTLQLKSPISLIFLIYIFSPKKSLLSFTCLSIRSYVSVILCICPYKINISFHIISFSVLFVIYVFSHSLAAFLKSLQFFFFLHFYTIKSIYLFPF